MCPIIFVNKIEDSHLISLLTFQTAAYTQLYDDTSSCEAGYKGDAFCFLS